MPSPSSHARRQAPCGGRPHACAQVRAHGCCSFCLRCARGPPRGCASETRGGTGDAPAAPAWPWPPECVVLPPLAPCGSCHQSGRRVARAPLRPAPVPRSLAPACLLSACLLPTCHPHRLCRVAWAPEPCATPHEAAPPPPCLPVSTDVLAAPPRSQPRRVRSAFPSTPILLCSSLSVGTARGSPPTRLCPTAARRSLRSRMATGSLAGWLAARPADDGAGRGGWVMGDVAEWPVHPPIRFHHPGRRGLRHRRLAASARDHWRAGGVVERCVRLLGWAGHGIWGGQREVKATVKAYRARPGSRDWPRNQKRSSSLGSGQGGPVV